MNKFFDDNYLIDNQAGRVLYDAVKDMPIFDYHSHLPSREIFEDNVYQDLAELWLKSDHYKWRLMRLAGVDEKYITGDASPRDKFYEFARILPLFVGNPVYDWAHLELRRYFDIDMPICEANASYIWSETSEIIAEKCYSPRKLLKMAKVDTLMTTDDPIDNLEFHKKLRDSDFDIKVIPTFRADRVIAIDKPDFRSYVNNMAKVANTNINDISSLLLAVRSRLEYFVMMGSTIADISVKDIPAIATIDEAETAFTKAMNGEELTLSDINAYMFVMLSEVAKLFSEKDIVMQLHIGALRNQNTMRYLECGADSGIDSVASELDIDNLRDFLDALEREDKLPRSIYYSHNENAYYKLSCMLGNFAGKVKGKLQLGAAWWMMDSREGIRRQLETFKNTAGLGYFNGMLTDSRSFTSFVRHDYFRRVLCSFVGEMVERGGAPRDESIIDFVKNIAYNNAKSFFA